MQEKRAALRESPETAECLAMLFRGAATPSDMCYLKRVFGEPQLYEFKRLSECPEMYEDFASETPNPVDGDDDSVDNDE